MLLTNKLRSNLQEQLNRELKIQAFTLSEMSAVLVITSIVVGIAFSVLSLVQTHMHSIQNNLENINEINRLNQSIWIDFNKYSKITYSSKNGILAFVSELDSITYKFTQKGIIKKEDTFYLQVFKKQFYFDGSLVKEGLVDAIKIETSKGYQGKNLFIFNNNDASLFMN
ncbi:prepilin-type N-terminal cleavage/methylation domain-containing protein [Pontimicrobium sp. SW4]|uniref:Prepilin-type N-terminal cleavage/methylation domain-containing protein n=1 Tax=Pontimicrobium sp. SW4 TaxID=3153519 RepID=A0AAU7BQB9_9FLAO